MQTQRPTERFTNRVADYVRFRPDYPAEIIGILQREIGLSPDWTVADIGSGPGNLARCFLDFGCAVYGVEPNEAMQQAGEQLLSDESRFMSIAGSAETTNLDDRSVDLVTAGQAFHWFDPPRTRNEFLRILREPGWVVLIWNRRPAGESPVLDATSAMFRQYAPEYERVVVRDSAARAGMDTLFGKGKYRLFTLPHEQLLDAEGFWGRLMSSSYMPLPGEPGHDEIRARSREIFDEFAVDGILRYPYATQIYVGCLVRNGA